MCFFPQAQAEPGPSAAAPWSQIHTGSVVQVPWHRVPRVPPLHLLLQLDEPRGLRAVPLLGGTLAEGKDAQIRALPRGRGC